MMGEPDCNSNGIPDTCDIDAGELDCNQNDIPDVCEGPLFTNYCTAVPNTTGLPGQIGYTGSNSILANDLLLVATDIPNNTGIFITSPDQVQLPLGNGNVCVGSTTLGFVRRLFPSYVAQNNTASLMLDHTVAPLAQLFPRAGQTWNYQAWFRDFVGSGFNFTNALSVTYCP